MSYFIDDDSSQIRGLKDKIDELQALILANQSSVSLENVESGQSIFPGANPSSRGGGAGGGGSGHVIQEEGVSLTARANLNFIGGAVTAMDNAVTGATDVTITGLADNLGNHIATMQLDMAGNNIISTVDPATNIFQVVFDAHDDSDTFISNGLTTDKIYFVSNMTTVMEMLDTEVLFNSTTPLNMNTSEINSVGFISFGASPPSSGRIRLPNGVNGAIKWESTPAGFDGEMYFDNDFNWFVDSGQAYKYWVGGYTSNRD